MTKPNGRKKSVKKGKWNKDKSKINKQRCNKENL